MAEERNASSFKEQALARELLNRQTVYRILETTIRSMLILSALTGNLLTCLAIRRNPKLRTLPNYYVATLAVADALMAVLVMPLSLTTDIAGRWVFGNVVCQYQGFVGTVLGIVTLFTIALTALNRYFKIVKTEKYARLYTAVQTRRSIAVAWLLASAVPIPYLAIGDRYLFHPGKRLCLFDLDQTNAVYALTTILGFVLVPFAVISFCYWRVFSTVRAHQRNRVNPRPHSVNFSREIKITRLLAAIFVAFLLSWTPFVVVDVLGVVLGQFALPHVAYLVYGYSVNLSSAVNPVIYALMNREFRNEVKALLRFKQPPGVQTSPVIPLSSKRVKSGSRKLVTRTLTVSEKGQSSKV